MSTTISDALTREHHDIDAGIEAFVAQLGQGNLDPAPLETAFAALRRHIWLEEAFLFPPIRDAGAVMPILVMLREHGELWRAMDELGEQLARPAADHDQVAAACRELLERLDRHNGKEEPIIYPRAETDLDAEATAELAEYLRTGATPDGWVCQAAGQPQPAAFMPSSPPGSGGS